MVNIPLLGYMVVDAEEKGVMAKLRICHKISAWMWCMTLPITAHCPKKWVQPSLTAIWYTASAGRRTKDGSVRTSQTEKCSEYFITHTHTQF